MQNQLQFLKKSKLLLAMLCFLSFQVFAQNNITFQVDMGNQIAEGTFDPLTQVVFVTGGNANTPEPYNFCGTAMTDTNNDDVYELTRSFSGSATIGYKFYIGTTADVGSGNCTGAVAGYEANLSAPCGFGNFGDRQHIVNNTDATLPIVCFASCFDCDFCPDGTVSYDGYISTVLSSKCGSCHIASSVGGFNLGTYAGLLAGGNNCGQGVVPGLPSSSSLIDKTQWVTGGSASCGANMPTGANTPLTVAEFNVINQWIIDGAPENCAEPLTVDYTFIVDMNCSETTLRPPGVVGPPWNWCNTGCNAMTDTDGDDIWEITIAFIPGDIVEYKYEVASFADQENLVDDMVGGATCAPVTDFFAYANREILIGSSDLTIQDTYGTCSTCAALPVEITFEVDMNCSGSTDVPSLESSLNGFCGGCALTTDDDMDGIWEITLSLIPGDTINYVYAINSGAIAENLIDDMLAGGSCAPDTDFNSYANRQIVVPNMATTVTSTFDTCGSCGSCPTTLTLNANPEITGTYQADDWISSNSIVNSGSAGPVNYNAGDDYILLNAGFVADGSVDFTAEIIDCDLGN